MLLSILGVLLLKKKYLLLNSNNLFFSSLLRKNNMQKNYFKKNVQSSNLNPKKDTIKFLLDYSKSLNIIYLNFGQIEINLN